MVEFWCQSLRPDIFSVWCKIMGMSEDDLEEEHIIEEREHDENNAPLSLSLSVREPIEKLLYNEPLTVSKTATVKEVVNLFNDKDVGCVLIVEKDKLVGIFTERDVIRKVIDLGAVALNEKVEKFMTARPETLKLSDPIAFALNKMAAGGYRHIPLVDDKGAPVGCISVRNVVDYLADSHAKEILNLPPEPDIVQTSREGG